MALDAKLVRRAALLALVALGVLPASAQTAVRPPAAATACSGRAAAAGPALREGATVFVVRHADKLNESKTSPLSPTGMEQAVQLRDTLAPQGIAFIVTSEKLRTQQTAASFDASIKRAGSASVSEVIKLVRNNLDGPVLVVGHSETVGRIASALGVPVDIKVRGFGELFTLKGMAGKTACSRGSYLTR